MRRSICTYSIFIVTGCLASTAHAQSSDTEVIEGSARADAGDSAELYGASDDRPTSAAKSAEETPTGGPSDGTAAEKDGPPVSSVPSAAARQPRRRRARSNAPPTQEEYDELADRLDMMEEDIERILGEQDKLKARSLADRLNWSGSYRFDINAFHLKEYIEELRVTHLQVQTNEDGTPRINQETGRPVLAGVEEPVVVSDRDRWMAPSWTHRLKLAMTYDFGESLRFYSQLGVYKYFNETLNTIGMVDHGSNAYPRDNAFRLERVYFDWFVADWMAISVGRIASPDGPPTELKENADRRSGWGVQMVNATIDTVMTTFYLGKKNYLRAFYSPFGLHGEYSVISEISLIDDKGIDLFHSWGAIFEAAIPRMKDSIFQLGFLHVPKFTPRDVRIAFPGVGPVAPSDPTGDDLGMYMGANTLILLKNIADSGLDFFFAYGLTILRPTEERMVYNVPATFAIHDPSGADTGQTVDVVNEWTTGLASFEEGKGTTNFGHTIYTGLRYTLPLNERYPTRIGGEFNWGTKYHLAWSHPNDQLINKLGNKGITGEAYIIQQLVPDHLFARVGYIEMHRDYQGTFIGPTAEVDQRVRDIYFLVDLSW